MPVTLHVANTYLGGVCMLVYARPVMVRVWENLLSASVCWRSGKRLQEGMH